MLEQSNNHQKVFHMSLGEPLFLAVIVPILGVSLSAWLYLAQQIYVGVWLPIIVLILSVLAIYQGMMMPTKIEIQSGEIVIYYLARKRTVNVGDINSYYIDHETVGRYGPSGTRTFVTLHLNTGRIINFKNIKEDIVSLIETLEKRTGLKPAEIKNFQAIMEQQEAEWERQDQILQIRSGVSLSMQTEQLIKELFNPEEHDYVRQRLIEIGQVFSHEYINDREEFDRLCNTALGKSKGKLKKFDRQVGDVKLSLDIRRRMGK